MKVYKHRISAATNSAQGSGTTYYLVTFDQIQKFFNGEDSNVWIGKSFEELGWAAIDFDNNLFGSQIIGDDLYICVTDGKDIEVNGDLVNPEEALEICAPDDLSEYIKSASNGIIQRYITEYEIVMPDFDNWAADLLEDNISFSRMVSDFHEFD
ncbi:MAG: hypothetical protein NC320_01695 [Clostridium sp.]|nr:hypothetical protein [Clostridium sp.]